MAGKTLQARLRGVWDIECSGWDAYALGGALDLETGQILTTMDPDELYRFVSERPGDWWAHNGGRYDALWYAEQGRARGDDLLPHCPGSSVTRLHAVGAGVTLRDSAALIPMRLEDAAVMAGGQVKIGTGLPCICAEECGGYCSITPRCLGMSTEHVARLREYLECDLRALADVMYYAFGYADEHGLHLSGTIGASAWRTAQSELGLPAALWHHPAQFKESRQAYAGGIVAVGREYCESGHRYDLHSAYPAQLAELAVPWGDYRGVPREAASRCYGRGLPGLFRATVHVPPMQFPPLHVTHRETGRVCFPFGTLHGIWTLPELQFAEELGCSILGFRHALVWESAEPVFAPMMERVWELRAQAIEDENRAAVARGEPPVRGLSKWLKLILNSITGKLASRPEVVRYRMTPDRPQCAGCRAEDKACKCWEPMDPWCRIWERPQWLISDCAHVQAAAYLTASCRIEWLRQAMHAGDDFVYGDTDSVYSRRELTRRIGDGLGWWGYDGPMRDFIALGPKTYRYLDPDDGMVCKAKGIPRIDAERFALLSAGLPVPMDRGVDGFKWGARHNTSLFQRRDARRRHLPDPHLIGCRLRRREHEATEAMEWDQLRGMLSTLTERRVRPN